MRTLLTALLLVHGPAAAATHAQDPPARGDWTRIDPGIGDADPLETSFRELPFDFREPLSFDDVYAVPGRPDLLVRASGAVYAVFPRSRYVATKAGVVPVVPNDTVFYLGLPALAALGAAASTPPTAEGARSPLAGLSAGSDAGAVRLETRIESRVLDDERARGARRPDDDAGLRRAESAHDQPAARARTVVTNPLYRMRRIRELMQRAADAAEGRQAARGPSSSSSSK